MPIKNPASILIFLVIILITFLIAFGLGYQMNNQLVWKKIQQKVKQLPLQMELRDEIKNITGEIVKIDNDVIELKINPLAMGLLIPQDYLIKKITLTETTKIFQKIKKSDEEYNAELIEQQSTSPELPKAGLGMGLPTTLNHYKTVNLTINDLLMGQQIKVRINEDAKTVDDLTAMEIVLIVD